MTSQFAAGADHNPQELPAAQAWPPGKLFQLRASDVKLDLATSQSANTSVPNHNNESLAGLADQHGSTRQVVHQSIVVTDTTGMQSSLPLYNEIAPFPSRPTINAISRKALFATTTLVDLTTIVASSNSTHTTGDARGHGTEAPAMAKVYPQANVADFAPWRGKHLEDNMTEQTIKSGFQNKALITNELNTARPSLWSHLKNKGGPQTLSSLFVNLLEKRQASCNLTANSTFKPPPRLAMSNARRESFFRELADPSWPMRKLNRSVPHTISGRVLLDQCLTKNIPIPRAAWLAKCIGANDIRALKRKSATGTTGIGGEAKYIKDWTVHVEQFLKTVLATVDDGGWKAKADYAIRLSALLFSEHVLDEDHFIDWLLLSFEYCSTQTLPVWLLLIQIFWTHLTSNRRRGSRLAEALLNHLERLTEDDVDDLLKPAIDRVEELLIVLASSKNGCLIIPRNWSRYRSIIQKLSTKSGSSAVQLSIANVTFRNDRLLNRPSTSSSGNLTRNSQIIQTLDLSALTLPIGRLLELCLDIEPTAQILIPCLLKWSASCYRFGVYRAYVVSRLVRKLRRKHDDVDSILLNTIQKLCSVSNIFKLDLYRVVVELVRAKEFSVGLFIQHLIATGAADSKDEDHQSMIELLGHIPDFGLEDGISSMRLDLLSTASVLSQADSDAFEDLEDAILDSLSKQNQQETSLSIAIKSKIPFLSQAFSVGYHVRNQMIVIIQDIVQAGNDHWNTFGALKAFENSFVFTRSVLERMSEFACLADILGAALDLDNQIILTSIIQTLHSNYRNYIGLGAMKSLFDKLVLTYETIRNHQSLIPSFCSAILELARTLQANPLLIVQLSQDRLRSDQLHAVAICSPASDNADMMQMTGMDEDEIERILSSGTSMDEKMVARVFERIVKKMEEAFGTGTACDFPFSNWLSRLRVFDVATFNRSLRRQITDLLGSVEGIRLLNTFLLPVINSCSILSLADYISLVRGTDNELRNNAALSLYCNIELLGMLIPDEEHHFNCNSIDTYSLKLNQQLLARQHPEIVISVLGEILSTKENSILPDNNTFDMRKVLTPAVRNYLVVCLPTAEACLHQLIDVLRGLDDSNAQHGCSLVDLLLCPNRHVLIEHPIVEKPVAIVRQMDELSLPFCTLALDFFQNDVQQCGKRASGATQTDEVANVLLQSIISSMHEAESIGFEILSSLHIDIRTQLFSLAERHILNSLSAEEHGLSELNGYMKVIECTSPKPQEGVDLGMPAIIVDKLRSIVYQLTADADFGQKEDQVIEKAVPLHVQAHWINLLCTLVVRRRPGSSLQKLHQHDGLALFSSLSALVALPQLQAFGDTMDMIFDILSMLSDDLTDDQRAFLAKSEPWRFSHPRLAFLQSSLGNTNHNTWLGLVVPQQQIHASGNTVQSSQGHSAPPRTPGAHTPASHPSPHPQTPSQLYRGHQQSQQGTTRTTGAQTNAPKAFQPPVPYSLKYWELIWDQGSAGTANDTAISLSLFSMRKA